MGIFKPVISLKSLLFASKFKSHIMYRVVRNKFILTLLVFVCSASSVHSQLRIEPTEGGMKGEPTGYVVYGSDDLSDRIPYTRITGSPFWKDNWQLATLYADTRKVTTVPVRLNLATNEIHFLENDKEYVLLDKNVSIIAFHPGTDTSTTTQIFIQHVPDMSLMSKNFNGFIQVMNRGNYQLLKYTERKVSSADSLFRTQKRYFFADELHYFLRFNEKIERIKKLRKENILEFVPSASSYSSWIAENNIDFKKEPDVIRFLDYYNGMHPAKTE